MVLSCGEDECNITDSYVDFVINSIASHHATSNKEFSTTYKIIDFGIIKVSNCYYVDFIQVRDMCMQRDITCTLIF